MFKEKKPQDVEEELEDLFVRYNIYPSISVNKVKRWIYESVGKNSMDVFNKYCKKWHKFLPDFKNLEEANYVLGIFSDAWNYFPHKELGNKSPNDLIKKNLSSKSETSKNVPNGPKIICNGVEMEFDKYQEMIKEMTKLQIPFKKWIKKELLPNYKKYLSKLHKNKKLQEQDYDVAEIFFQRVLHVGFIDLIEIRINFIQKEFPNWWPTHVLYSNLKPAGVLSSVGRLFGFIGFLYYIDSKVFGFK